MPATGAGMTKERSRLVSKTFTDLRGALAGGHHQKAKVGLRGDEAHAFLDEGVLTRKIALAAEPGIFAVRFAGRDHTLDRHHDRGIAEGSGLAHIGEKIVAANMQHVDALDL